MNGKSYRLLMDPTAHPNPPPLLRVPSDIPADPDGSMQWWKPGFKDVARMLGVRWLYIVPFAALIIGAVVLAFRPAAFFAVMFYGLKLWILIVGIAIATAVEGVRQATKLRSDLFCIHCGYTLAGLPDNHYCPECGRPYSFHLIDQYRRDPHFFIHRWKLQKVVPAVPFHALPSTRPRSRDGT